MDERLNAVEEERNGVYRELELHIGNKCKDKGESNKCVSELRMAIE